MLGARSVVVAVISCALITLLLIFSEQLGLRDWQKHLEIDHLFSCAECDSKRESGTSGHGNSYASASVSVNGEGAMGAGTATSGKLFSGSKVASWDPKQLRFASFLESSPPPRSQRAETFEAHPLRCSHWSVVTTIFEPSDAVKRQVALKGWCIVVVGDRKGPKDYPIKAPEGNLVFLTAADQERLAQHFPLVQALPWNHFGRKNVGFLYAILHGARFVWDFDDDNMLLSEVPLLEVPGNPWLKPPGKQSSPPNSINSTAETPTSFGFGTSFNVHAVRDYNFPSFNPYPVMGAPSSPCWPRGLPLEHIKLAGPVYNRSTLYESHVPTASVGVVQSLANHDPDMDAIFRLTMPIPFDFPAGTRPLLVPPLTYAPYNAQATLHLYSSLWSLLLPVTVHGRVSDIWRGYVTQRLGRDIGMRLLFAPPMVRQDRNSHNYLADFDSEGPLYKRASKLLSQLDEWKPRASSLVGRIEEVWVYLYEHGYFGAEDVVLVQAWLQSLLDAGYVFPKLQTGAP